MPATESDWRSVKKSSSGMAEKSVLCRAKPQAQFLDLPSRQER
jgi:hypothetical protein